MFRTTSIGLVLILFVGGAATAGEESLTASKDATFRRGNDAYFHGRYSQAVEAYEQIAALGVISPDLYYNLGNAYVKAGGLGPGIFNYERALELDPTAEDVRYNLEAARETVRKRADDRLVGAESMPWWIRTVEPFTVSGLSWLFLGLYAAVFLLLIALHFVPPGFVRTGMWACFAFLVVGAGASGALLGGRLYLAERVAQAIVLPDSVQVKEGPDTNYQTLFNIHSGLRVRVTERDQDWVRVRLGNGLEGWLRDAELGRL
jgi:tetratricopeptide (TPR) repeat protein